MINNFNSRRSLEDAGFDRDFGPHATKITYWDSDNIDIYKYNIKKKRYLDVMALPDKLPAIESMSKSVAFEYDYDVKESNRIIRPEIFNKGKTMSFSFYCDKFIDPERLQLVMTIVNTNENNYLKYDCPPIESITFYNNGEILEQIVDYHIIHSLLNDITYKSNYYEDNTQEKTHTIKLDSTKLTEGTNSRMIPPKVLGTNNLYNPKKIIEDYRIDSNTIRNGILSYNTNYIQEFKFNIVSYLFGKYHSKTSNGVYFKKYDSRLVPMFLFQSFQIVINLHNYAFFVPIFKTSVEDLYNHNFLINQNYSDDFLNLCNEFTTLFKTSRKHVAFGKVKFGGLPNYSFNQLMKYLFSNESENSVYIQVRDQILKIYDSNTLDYKKKIINLIEIELYMYYYNTGIKKRSLEEYIESKTNQVVANFGLFPDLFALVFLKDIKIEVVQKMGNDYFFWIEFNPIPNPKYTFFYCLQEKTFYMESPQGNYRLLEERHAKSEDLFMAKTSQYLYYPFSFRSKSCALFSCFGNLRNIYELVSFGENNNRVDNQNKYLYLIPFLKEKTNAVLAHYGTQNYFSHEEFIDNFSQEGKKKIKKITNVTDIKDDNFFFKKNNIGVVIRRARCYMINFNGEFTYGCIKSNYSAFYKFINEERNYLNSIQLFKSDFFRTNETNKTNFIEKYAKFNPLGCLFSFLFFPEGLIPLSQENYDIAEKFLLISGPLNFQYENIPLEYLQVGEDLTEYKYYLLLFYKIVSYIAKEGEIIQSDFITKYGDELAFRELFFGYMKSTFIYFTKNNGDNLIETYVKKDDYDLVWNSMYFDNVNYFLNNNKSARAFLLAVDILLCLCEGLGDGYLLENIIKKNNQVFLNEYNDVWNPLVLLNKSMNSGIHLPNSQFGDIYSDYLLGVENGHRDLAKNKITENFDMNVISYNLFSYSKDEFPNIHSEESGFFERIYENIYIKHPRYINTLTYYNVDSFISDFNGVLDLCHDYIKKKINRNDSFLQTLVAFAKGMIEIDLDVELGINENSVFAQRKKINIRSGKNVKYFSSGDILSDEDELLLVFFSVLLELAFFFEDAIVSGLSEEGEKLINEKNILYLDTRNFSEFYRDFYVKQHKEFLSAYFNIMKQEDKYVIFLLNKKILYLFDVVSRINYDHFNVFLAYKVNDSDDVDLTFIGGQSTKNEILKKAPNFKELDTELLKLHKKMTLKLLTEDLIDERKILMNLCNFVGVLLSNTNDKYFAGLYIDVLPALMIIFEEFANGTQRSDLVKCLYSSYLHKAFNFWMRNLGEPSKVFLNLSQNHQISSRFMDLLITNNDFANVKKIQETNVYELEKNYYLSGKNLKDILKKSNTSKISDAVQKSLSLSRKYDYNAYLLLYQVDFKNAEIYNKYKTEGYIVEGSMFEIYNRTTFIDRPPLECRFSTYELDLLNVFFGIYNNCYVNYPTYRMTNRYSRGIKLFGSEINKIKYPQEYINADLGNSLTNGEYLSNLEKSIEISYTNINNFNSALDNNSSMFLTKKIYAFDSDLIEVERIENGVLFKNMFFDSCRNEIVGRALISLNLNYFYEKVGEDLRNTNKDFIVVIDSDVGTEEENGKDNIASPSDFNYDLVTFFEYTRRLAIDVNGNLIV